MISSDPVEKPRAPIAQQIVEEELDLVLAWQRAVLSGYRRVRLPARQ